MNIYNKKEIKFCDVIVIFWNKVMIYIVIILIVFMVIKYWNKVVFVIILIVFMVINIGMK